MAQTAFPTNAEKPKIQPSYIQSNNMCEIVRMSFLWIGNKQVNFATSRKSGHLP